ncbi:DUF2235 domain-containing protein [Pseudomonas sp. S 311-6]|uniref:T6SS phospholipase effector Tle1-like catalytic domain-containing protein n=1 Tax=Pseudomonas TaxID=286 RepID=UPI0020976E2F|nr:MULTISPECIES: DUF2235 domain-containing protein [Pseudomonas]MCO7568224.1 DUF2235 domain-containing protein [Pseudomonas mosselii]MCO7619891.1 DUF2235 domain-containing protein [Pseudomonas guariconensis]MCO7643713.1 DUF2235 domain-containing protein [Pseudomonas sp. S 311-6]
MSEVNNNEPVYVPAMFPPEGRLPHDLQAVRANYRQQKAEERDYRQQENAARGGPGALTCAHSLHISLFFDGTNNNEFYDTREAVPPHPTNIARIYHASLLGQDEGYFRYYIPGVGTPFPEIGEMDFSRRGLIFAHRGEDRINWGLLRIADALMYALNEKRGLKLPQAQAMLQKMSTTWPLTDLGRASRRVAMQELLEPLRARVDKALPKVVAIKLFVYGFSRGAAEARTFVRWLSELFDTPEGADKPAQSLLGIPLSIEFLGLLDTVASVGSAHAAPFAAGHMDWADGTMPLPDAARFPEWIKHCRHFVAAHEQRLCFPLDSIRDEAGHYPGYAREVVYPGMHSDVGGGYPPGDQGKARGGPGELLSQIALHDLYAAAFAAGAPLTVPEAVVPEELRQIKPVRKMDPVTGNEFDFSQELVHRFNAWRSVTLGLAEPSADTDTASAEPLRAGHDLETILAAQLAWITGWRIERFARGSYANQPFYGLAKQTNATDQKKEKAAREDKQKQIKDKRREARGQPNEAELLLRTANVPDYEAVVDQTQISEAAVEFEHDYAERWRSQTSVVGFTVDVLLRDTVLLLNDDDEQAQFQRLKAEGDQRAAELFMEGPTGHYQPSDEPGLAALVALFDDQVHDSRAWFMHAATGSRELWGDYFRDRMVYFGDACSKRATPVVIAGRVVGIAVLLGGTYAIRKQGWKGLAGTLGAATIGYQVIDAVSGETVPFVPGAQTILQPTHAIGQVVAQQGKALFDAEQALRMQTMLAYLRQTGGLVEPAKAVLS